MSSAASSGSWASPVKKTYGYRERDEAKRQAFLTELESVPEDKRVWIDETGMDSNESYAYGWSAKGQRCHASKPGGSKIRVSIIAGLHNQTMAAPCYFTGSTDARLFNEWLECHLLPTLPEGVTIIMDNARFHKSSRTREIIEQAKCHLLFLSPYSPDFNPIEHRWFQLKNTARKIMRTYLCLKSAVEAAILNHG